MPDAPKINAWAMFVLSVNKLDVLSLHLILLATSSTKADALLLQVRKGIYGSKHRMNYSSVCLLLSLEHCVGCRDADGVNTTGDTYDCYDSSMRRHVAVA